MQKFIPTAPTAKLKDLRLEKPPPSATKLLVLSKYGILRLGLPLEGFDVAWSELPKIPESVKESMSVCQTE